jgi:hypothetical protein
VFSTYAPSWKGEQVAYGLEGFDDPVSQRLGSLLALLSGATFASTK